MYSVEERLARLEAKLERMEKLEDELKKTQESLRITQSVIKDLARVVDKNFAILSGRVNKKSDGILSDLFNW